MIYGRFISPTRGVTCAKGGNWSRLYLDSIFGNGRTRKIMRVDFGGLVVGCYESAAHSRIRLRFELKVNLEKLLKINNLLYFSTVK